ncbi:Presequence protease_ mitochondriallike, partial [Caligus rogercresseyi]
CHSSGPYLWPLFWRNARGNTNLTYDGLKTFQSTHYNPANAKFYSYGDVDLSEHLPFLSDYLKDIPRGKAVPKVLAQTRWKSPREELFTAPWIHPIPDLRAAFAFLTCDSTDTYEAFALNILGELLIDGPNAPFYKSLLESNLGSSFAPCTGYMSDTKDNVFAIGIQGMDPQNESKFAEAVRNTFSRVAEEGFDHTRVEAILHRIELSMRKKSSNFGINLIMSLTPFGIKRMTPWMPSLRANLKANPAYFQDLLKKYYIDNPHQLMMTMHQKETFTQEKETVFEDICEKHARIFEEGKELIQSQNQIEDLSSLPTLKIEEISDQTKAYQSDELSHNLSFCSQATNGLAYFRSLISTRDLPSDLRPFLPLFLSIVTKLGAGEYSYREFDTEVDLATGGLSMSYHLTESSSCLNTFTEGILLSSYALERNTRIECSSCGAINQVVHSGTRLCHDPQCSKAHTCCCAEGVFGGLHTLSTSTKSHKNKQSYEGFLKGLDSEQGSYPLKEFPTESSSNNLRTFSINTGVSMIHPDYAPLCVLARLATFKYLHTEIREKGGAYGGGAKMVGMDSLPFTPTETPTLTRPRISPLSSGIDKDSVHESILGVFQKVDSP